MVVGLLWIFRLVRALRLAEADEEENQADLDQENEHAAYSEANEDWVLLMQAQAVPHWKVNVEDAETDQI